MLFFDMEEKQILSININNIKDCIYVMRGQKVMPDFDLARIYGYETNISIDKLETTLKYLIMILCLN